MGRKRYRVEKVVIEAAEMRNASWGFAGRTISGTEYSFLVTDGNYRQRNRWNFVVRVPRNAKERVEVRPTMVPNDSALVDLERRSLTFNRATRGRYRGFRYCQVALADSAGHRTKDVVHRGEKDSLPAWFGQFHNRMKVKDTVRRSHGTDGHALVALARPDDYKTMIGLYFAMKTWVLKEGIVLSE